MCVLIYKFYIYASLLIYIMNTGKKHVFKIWNNPYFKMITLCVIGTSNLVIVTKNNHYHSKIWPPLQFISNLCLRSLHTYTSCLSHTEIFKAGRKSIISLLNKPRYSFTHCTGLISCFGTFIFKYLAKGNNFIQALVNLSRQNKQNVGH